MQLKIIFSRIFSVLLEKVKKGPYFQFLLPTLCQTALDCKGCNALIEYEGRKQLLKHLFQLVEGVSQEIVDTIQLTYHIIIEVLLKRYEMQIQVMAIDFLLVLLVLATWPANYKGITIGSDELVSPALIGASVSQVEILTMEVINSKWFLVQVIRLCCLIGFLSSQ
jgi:hypothetical protein